MRRLVGIALLMKQPRLGVGLPRLGPFAAQAGQIQGDGMAASRESHKIRCRKTYLAVDALHTPLPKFPPVQHGAARSGLPPVGRGRDSWRGAHALQQEVDMKREDMGTIVLPPSRPARNPRIEKISRPRRSFPESRFSQAGKASEGASRRIRSFPGARPDPQCPYGHRFAQASPRPRSPPPPRRRFVRASPCPAPPNRPGGPRPDSGRFAPNDNITDESMASAERSRWISLDPRRILPGQCGEGTALPGSPSRER